MCDIVTHEIAVRQTGNTSAVASVKSTLGWVVVAAIAATVLFMVCSSRWPALASAFGYPRVAYWSEYGLTGIGAVIPNLSEYVLAAFFGSLGYLFLVVLLEILLRKRLLAVVALLLSVWFSSIGYAYLAVVAAITLFGFRTSLGGRPLVNLGASTNEKIPV